MAQEMAIPETPLVRSARLEREYGLAAATARQMVLTSWELADMFELLCPRVGNEAATTWTLGALSSHWKELQERLDDAIEEDIIKLIEGVCAGKITDTEARMRIGILAGREVEAVAPTSSSGGDLEVLITRLVDDHPEVVRDYRTNPRAANFLVGQAMKETKGQYSSRDIAEGIKKELEKRA